MATPETGSQPSEQPLSSPVNREHPNRIYKPPLPSNGYELFLRCTFDIQERQRDAILSAMDDNQAQEERPVLLHNPIYTGEIEPTGDGTTVIIQPGYFQGADFYQDAIKCFNNAGYQAMVMPASRGINIEPSRVIARRNMRFIMEAAEHNGKSVIIVGHSKGVQDTEVEAGLFPAEFEQTVSMVFAVHYPSNIEWVNSTVLCRPNPAYSAFREEDFKMHQRFANSLREISVLTIALMNLHDKIIQGTSNANEVITNNNSHRGALSCLETVNNILDKLPKKSPRSLPAAA